MDRRSFLGALALAPLLGVRPREAHTASIARGLVCTPYDGNGVQRCEAGIDSRVLNVLASETQDRTQWCWAACIEAVFRYHGHPVDQSRIVESIFGRRVNMPGTPGQILSAVNRVWTDDRGRRFRAFGVSLGTSAMNAAQDLAADFPLIVGTMGHAMVMTSLTYARDVYGRGRVLLAEVRDPWPYNPNHRTLSPREWYGITFAARIRLRSLG